MGVLGRSKYLIECNIFLQCNPTVMNNFRIVPFTEVHCTVTVHFWHVPTLATLDTQLSIVAAVGSGYSLAAMQLRLEQHSAFHNRLQQLHFCSNGRKQFDGPCYQETAEKTLNLLPMMTLCSTIFTKRTLAWGACCKCDAQNGYKSQLWRLQLSI